MKLYSIDLRQKIVDSYLAGWIPHSKLSRQFRVAPSFVGKSLKEYRDTGSVAPKIRTQQTPPKLNNDSLFARTPKGQRARGKRPNKRAKNVSLIGAISLKGVITQLPILGAVDGITFEAFIAQKLAPKLCKGACVVFDNYTVHLREIIEVMAMAAGARLIYLPPYSPDFSPIENCWSKIKARLRASVQEPIVT